ncbi:MAG: hypothetical protein R2781_08930 [Flavobacteriaceae bacterium]
MKLNEHRMSGIRAANAINAKETFDAIKDPNSCFEDILKVAIKENGLSAVVDHVLTNDPELSFEMLRSIPNLGEHRDKLIKKTGESKVWALHTLRQIPNLGENEAFLKNKLGDSFQSFGNISAFNLLDQAWYNCQFTMFWINQGVQYPQAEIPRDNWDKWKWSSEMSGGGSGVTMKCTDFVLENTSLVAGNTVWIYMWVRAGDDIESAFRFTYDPNTTNVASFTATGTTKSTKLSLSSVAPPQ